MTVEEAWRSLTPKQAEFVRQYLICRNGSEAVRKAGYSTKNADVRADQLLGIIGICVILEDEQAKSQAKFQITRDAIIDGLANIAFNHIGNVGEWDEDGTFHLREQAKLTANDLRFIESIQTETIEGKNFVKVKTKMRTLAVERTKALELLGKHLGLWKEEDEGGREVANRRNREAVRGRVFDRVRKRRVG